MVGFFISAKRYWCLFWLPCVLTHVHWLWGITSFSLLPSISHLSLKCYGEGRVCCSFFFLSFQSLVLVFLAWDLISSPMSFSRVVVEGRMQLFIEQDLFLEQLLVFCSHQHKLLEISKEVKQFYLFIRFICHLLSVSTFLNSFTEELCIQINCIYHPQLTCL